MNKILLVMLFPFLAHYTLVSGMQLPAIFHSKTFKHYVAPAVGSAALIGLGYLGYNYVQNKNEQKKPVIWGLSACIGRRATMEDAHTAIINFNGSSKDAFFGIFDGHGGLKVADKAAQHLSKIVSQKINELPAAPIDDALKAAFLEFDVSTTQDEDVGSTALIGLLQDDKLHMAWIGDSRGMIIRNDKALIITRDHKPDNPEEKKRIEAAGGKILDMFPARIQGKNRTALALSRAFGDYAYKPDLVIAEPDIITTQLQQGDIVVLACDGMWDSLNADTVIDIVKRVQEIPDSKLRKEYPDLTQQCSHWIEEGNNTKLNLIARALRDSAHGYGSTDNISVLVMQARLQE